MPIVSSQFAWNSKAYFLWKIKKNTVNLSELVHRVVKVNGQFVSVFNVDTSYMNMFSSLEEVKHLCLSLNFNWK